MEQEDEGDRIMERTKSTPQYMLAAGQAAEFKDMLLPSAFLS